MICAKNDQPSYMQVTNQTQLSQDHGPLPSSAFVDNNRPTARPTVLTTSTKEGQAAAAKKRKNAVKKKADASAPKKPGKKKKSTD